MNAKHFSKRFSLSLSRYFSGGGKVLSAILTVAVFFALTSAVFAAIKDATTLTANDVKSLQATTDMTPYGQGLTQVEIIYNDGVDLSGLSAGNYQSVYTLEDRGTQTPNYGQVKLSGFKVDGQTVTLYAYQDTYATESNALIYNGENKTGSRSRNAFGIYCTGPWFRAKDGTIYFGSADDTENGYKALPTALSKMRLSGYQKRESLELRLHHAGDSEGSYLSLTDSKGNYTSANKWLETKDIGFNTDDGRGTLKSFEELNIQIPSTGATLTKAVSDDYVRGFLYVPNGYNASNKYPLVFTFTGDGTSFWILSDGTNNFGTGVMYDAATTSWLGEDAIVVNVHDRSAIGASYYDEEAGKSVQDLDYDYVVDDVNVIKYLIANYSVDPEKIIIHGNSRSTMAASTIIQALAGQPYTNDQDAMTWGSSERTKSLDKTVYDFTIGTFLCNNGLFGGPTSGYDLWSDDDRLAVAKTGLRAWIFDAEQDFNNIDAVEKQTSAYKEAGMDDDWINENLRLTAFPSELFYYWGESDHSTTRINYWYFGEPRNGRGIYYGSSCDVLPGGILNYNEKSKIGSSYEIITRGIRTTGGDQGTKDGHEYTVYADNFINWALEKSSAPSDTAIESIQATAEACFYGYKVGKVEIVYKDGTDLSGVKATDYAVYDRGFNNPEFGALTITGIAVEGNKVTLTIDSQTTDKITDRTRETYGTLCTSSAWYVDSEGKLHYGSEETTDKLGVTIYPNKIGKGLQRRKNLDLVLCVGGASVSVKNGIPSTNGTGEMLTNTVWKETILSDDLDKIELTMVNLGTAAKGYELINAAQGTEGKGYVPVFVIWPDNYDKTRAEPYPVIDYQTGMGVCYWEMVNGKTSDGNTYEGETDANNPGCNTVYDVMMTEWHRQYPEAIIMSVNVHYHDIETSAAEIAGAMDYAIANWNADPDNITIVGNSQGTLIASDVIRQRPDLINAYVECNGNFGTRFVDMDAMDRTVEHSSFSEWEEEEVTAVIDNEVSVWLLNGEADDTNPAVAQDTYNVLTDLYTEAGKSEEWIEKHVRISGFLSWQFKAWGETDHSVTKLVAWKYLGSPYNDPNGTVTSGTYKLSGQETNQPNYIYPTYKPMTEFEYTIYSDSVAEWVKNLNVDTADDTAPVLTASVESFTAKRGDTVTEVTISATQGSNLKWTTSGELPDGLTYSENGTYATISGKISLTAEAKTYKFTVSASNEAGTASKEISITVEASGSSLPEPVEAKAATPSEAAQNAVKNEKTVENLVKEIFGNNGLPDGVSSEVSTLDDNNATKTPTNFTADELETALSDAGATLTEGEDNFVVLETIQVTESKIYMLAVPKNILTPGMKIFLHLLKNVKNVGVTADVFAADGEAEEVEEAVFMDDNGNVINTVPDNLDENNVNIVAYMEADNTYTPVVASAEDEDSALGGSSGGCDAGFGLGAVFALMFALKFRKK